jgi:hypothetical protein
VTGPLVALLGRALALPGVRGWTSIADERELAAGVSNRAAIVLGRLQRAGDLTRSERASVQAWLVSQGDEVLQSWAQEACEAVVELRLLDGDAPIRGEALTRVVERRDDAESLVCVLGEAVFAGVAAAECEERRVLDGLREVDALATGPWRDWGAAVTGIKFRRAVGVWLRRASALDAGPWWLDLVALSAMPRRAIREALRPIALGVLSPLRIARSRHNSVSADRARSAEVIGCEDDRAMTAFDNGAVVRRIGDDIDVLLDEGSLCVRRRSGGVAGITAVVLRRGNRSEPASKSASGFWISLGEGDSGCTLVVSSETGNLVSNEEIAVEIVSG